jgi:hypothetical protein
MNDLITKILTLSIFLFFINSKIMADGKLSQDFINHAFASIDLLSLNEEYEKYCKKDSKYSNQYRQKIYEIFKANNLPLSAEKDIKKARERMRVELNQKFSTAESESERYEILRKTYYSMDKKDIDIIFTWIQEFGRMPRDDEKVNIRVIRTGGCNTFATINYIREIREQSKNHEVEFRRKYLP